MIQFVLVKSSDRPIRDLFLVTNVQWRIAVQIGWIFLGPPSLQCIVSCYVVCLVDCIVWGLYIVESIADIV